MTNLNENKAQRLLIRRLVNIPLNTSRQLHSQWPLEILGTPLAVAISVNRLNGVKALLDLGADPFSLVYNRVRFTPEDLRS